MGSSYFPKNIVFHLRAKAPTEEMKERRAKGEKKTRRYLLLIPIMLIQFLRRLFGRLRLHFQCSNSLTHRFPFFHKESKIYREVVVDT
jgi:hypothetical protein